VLAVDGTVVPDLEIDIPVEVTTNAPALNEGKTDSSNKTNSTNNEEITTDTTMSEPTIRVGLLTVDEETDNKVVVSCEKDWKLYDGDGGLLAELKAGKSVEAFYKKNRYWFDRGQGLEKTSSYLRFVPDELNSICTIENFDRTKTRGSAYPDNRFRNILELRYNSDKDRTWMINELPMELYLRGLGETSNISHAEFQKALIVVARTYALSMFEHKKKHASEYYDLSSYADDQVYKGYGQEERSPNLAENVQKTDGVVVTYDGETAITPYFSRSDGRTRSWGDVWYGDIPYLQGVSCPCDKGKTLWGHGVGMSASEALCQANNGKEWKDILKYFYTGIDLTKRWK
jgi:peptidoglycan hydrolase-like amidase